MHLKTRLSLAILCFIIPIFSFATTYTSISDGNWHTDPVWDQPGTPGIGDNVIIDGHDITLSNSNVSILRLEIYNTGNGSGIAGLLVNGAIDLNIAQDLYAYVGTVAQILKVETRLTSNINVDGDVYFERSSLNNTIHRMYLEIHGSSDFRVQGDLTYIYGNSLIDLVHEVEVYDDATLVVDGVATFETHGGPGLSCSIHAQAQVVFGSLIMNKTGGSTQYTRVDGFNAMLTILNDLKLYTDNTDSHFFQVRSGATVEINGNIELNNSTATDFATTIYIDNANSTIDLAGNIKMDALSDDDMTLKMSGASKLYMGGSLDRLGGFGEITMDIPSELILDGNTLQYIPQSIPGGAGIDELLITNLTINNTSPDGLYLSGEMIVHNNLELMNGIIHTNMDSIIIIEDGATSDPGTNTAYVDGPMIKKGSVAGSNFIFPVGNNGIFAPIAIDKHSNGSIEYTAQYFGCPPPIGVPTTPLEQLNQQGYWDLSRDDGAAVGDVTLFWDNAGITGITDTSNLVVAGYDNTSNWNSYGRSESQQVSSFAGGGGSIKNDLGCPPPIGVNLFALGTTDMVENALPIELVDFRAFKNSSNSKVYLEWKTASEENSHYFIIEKSYDGISFHEVGRVQAAQNSTSLQYYSGIDNEPAKGNNYYRIQLVDLDQIMSFSDLKSVFFGGQEDIPIIYPNPVQNQINVYGNSLKNKDVLVKILNLNGELIYQGQHRSQDGQLSVNASNMNIKKTGIYFLSYIDGNEIQTIKFMKL